MRHTVSQPTGSQPTGSQPTGSQSTGSQPTGSPVDDVTVVVASHNHRKHLLWSLARHRCPVIVVDNCSDDGTCPAITAAHPDVKLVRVEANLGAAARNIGAELATTPYVAFADGDSYWEGDSLRRASDLFAEYPRAGLLAARVLAGPATRTDPDTTPTDTTPLDAGKGLPGYPVLSFLGCAAVVRREAYLSVGGFAPPLHMYGEEALLALDLAAAGWGLYHVPSLVVRRLSAANGMDQAMRARQEVRNRLLTIWLRRPLRVCARAGMDALSDPSERAGLISALREAGWVMRERCPLPPAVEEAVAALEAGNPMAPGRQPPFRADPALPHR